MRIAFLVSYIGTDFHGSQQQPGVRTVEGEIIRSCQSLGLFSDWRDAKFQFSGRTDRGVHAREQICAFDTGYPERAVSNMNRKLPGDIRCSGWAEAPAGYSPRYEVKSRTYRYFFPGNGLDYEKMGEAADFLVGTHNFTRFARLNGKDPERKVISTEIIPRSDGVVLEIRGVSFLWNMVRCIAHPLWLIGRGLADPDMISEALVNLKGHRFPVAPAEGLVLWSIESGLNFRPVGNAQKSTKYIEKFGCRHQQLKKVSEILFESL